MRRKDREITDLQVIREIINNISCCRLGFYDDGEVYIVPMNFGVVYSKEDKITLYFHSAKEGRKIELISKSSSVGFEMDTNYKLKSAEIACDCTASFESIIGTGVVSFVEERIEKERGLNAIMYQSTKKGDWKYNDKMLDRVCVFKVQVTKISCKVHE